MRFARRRILRVVPLYWLLTSLVILGALITPDLLNVPLGGMGVIFGSYAFVPVFRADGGINPVLGQGWTLDYEMFFYTLFALALLLPRRFGLAALGATLIALAVLGRAWQPGGALAVVWTGELLLEFLFGMAIGLSQERGARVSAVTAVGIMALGVAGSVALGPIAPVFDDLSPVLRAGVPAALIVAGSVLGPRWAPRPGVLVVAAVGDASYSLYLCHPFVVRLLREAWERLVPAGVPLGWFVILACAATIPVSTALYRWLERPMTLALHRSSDGGRGLLRPDPAHRDG